MATRMALLVALLAVSAAGRAEDPPAKARKGSISGKVSSLNGLFKRDPTGAQAKSYVGRIATVYGTVRGVTATREGGQTLTLDGLPPTADDPAGCTIPFPAGHKSLGAVKALTAGMSVRVQGEIDSVTGMAFTLKDAVLVSAAAAPIAKGGAAVPGPVAKGGPAAPAPVAKGGPEAPAAGPKPPPPPLAQRIDLTKSTAAELTEALLTDPSQASTQRLKGKTVELSGVVRANVRAAGGGRTVTLFGWDAAVHKGQVRVTLQFPADGPDLPRVRSLGLWDEIKVRAVFEGRDSDSLDFNFSRAALLAGGDAPLPDYGKPTRTVPAAEFVREGLADPAMLAKLKGQVVALTGIVAAADPAATPAGLRLVGSPDNRNTPPYAECQATDDQLGAIWELPAGTRVRVVGVVGHRDATHTYFEPNLVVLGKCRVALLEPNPIPRLSAAELAKAYKEDWKAAGEKYGNRDDAKALILTGEVAALSAGPRATSVTLKPPEEGTEVVLSLPPAAADGLKVGQTIRAKVFMSGSFAPGIARFMMGGSLLPEAKAPLPVVK